MKKTLIAIALAAMALTGCVAHPNKPPQPPTSTTTTTTHTVTALPSTTTRGTLPPRTPFENPPISTGLGKG